MLPVTLPSGMKRPLAFSRNIIRALCIGSYATSPGANVFSSLAGGDETLTCNIAYGPRFEKITSTLSVLSATSFSIRSTITGFFDRSSVISNGPIRVFTMIGNVSSDMVGQIYFIIVNIYN